MLKQCAAHGFQAVAFDTLAAWTRFAGTPLADAVPFGEEEALAYAALLVQHAHQLGLVAGHTTTADQPQAAAQQPGGFDFVIVEDCGRDQDCLLDRARYHDHVLVIEHQCKAFQQVCQQVGAQLSVVLRDRALRPAGAAGYVYQAC